MNTITTTDLNEKEILDNAELTLIEPCEEYAEDLWAFKQEMNRQSL